MGKPFYAEKRHQHKNLKQMKIGKLTVFTFVASKTTAVKMKRIQQS